MALWRQEREVVLSVTLKCAMCGATWSFGYLVWPDGGAPKPMDRGDTRGACPMCGAWHESREQGQKPTRKRKAAR